MGNLPGNVDDWAIQGEEPELSPRTGPVESAVDEGELLNAVRGRLVLREQESVTRLGSYAGHRTNDVRG